MRPDGDRLALRHIDDLARTGGDRAGTRRDRQAPLQPHHDIVHGKGFVDALVGSIATVAEGDRPTVALVDHIAREHLPILSRRAPERCIGDGEPANSHGNRSVFRYDVDKLRQSATEVRI